VTRGQWLPGHDHRAVHQRIRRDHGNVAEFIDWYDKALPARRRQRATAATAAKRAA
jgi:hypothetical protein